MSQETLTPFSEKAKNLKLGIYEHYSGRRYQVLAIARHEETLEELVVYKALYGEGDHWVRKIDLFCETIEKEGCAIPRFKLIL